MPDPISLLCWLIVKLLKGQEDTFSFAFLIALLCPGQGEFLAPHSALLIWPMQRLGHPGISNHGKAMWLPLIMWWRGFPIQHAPMRTGKYKSLWNIFCRISFLPHGRKFKTFNIPILICASIGISDPLADGTGGSAHLWSPHKFLFNKPFSAASLPISFGNSNGKARGSTPPGRTRRPRGGTELAHVIFASGFAGVRWGHKEHKPSVIWNTESY